MPVDVSCDVKDADRYVRVLRSDALKLLKLLGRKNSELSILLTGDRRIKELNRDFRHKNRPTDVLSFSQTEAFDGGILEKSVQATEVGVIGDVVISIETAVRQACPVQQVANQHE